MTVKELLQQRRAHQAASGATVSTTFSGPSQSISGLLQLCVREDVEATHKHNPAQRFLHEFQMSFQVATSSHKNMRDMV